MNPSLDKEIKKISYHESKKSVFINICIIALVAIISGYFIGSWIMSLGSTDGLYDIDANSLYDNVVAIRDEASGKTPIELGAVKCAVLAIDTTGQEERVQVIGEGHVLSMGVTQNILAKQVRMGDKVMFENVSISSFVKATNRFYLKNNAITRVQGNVKGNSVVWNGATSTMTKEQYKELMGLEIYDYMSYIISSKTVITASDVTTTDDGNYTFNLTIDKVNGVVNYVKNMKETGGLGDYPRFSDNVSIEIVMDSNYRILKFKSDEKYEVKKGVWMAATGTLTNTFSYDQDFVIPATSENTAI